MSYAGSPQYSGVESTREYRSDGGITTIRPPTDLGVDRRNTVRTPGQRADLLLGLDDPAESRVADGKVRENRGLIGTPYPSSSMAGLAELNAKTRANMPLTPEEDRILTGVQGVGKMADIQLSVLMRPDFSSAVKLAHVYKAVKTGEDAPAEKPRIAAAPSVAHVKVKELPPYPEHGPVSANIANLYEELFKLHAAEAQRSAQSVTPQQAALDPRVREGTGLPAYQRTPGERLHGMFSDPRMVAATMLLPNLVDPNRHPLLGGIGRLLQLGSMAASVAGMFPSKRIKDYRDVLQNVRENAAYNRIKQHLDANKMRPQPLHAIANADIEPPAPQGATGV